MTLRVCKASLKFSKTSEVFYDLPRFMNRRFHHFLSLTYVISAIAVFIYWIIQTFIDRGAVFYTIHGLVGLASIILLVTTAITGWRRVIRNPGYRGIHRSVYGWAVFAFFASIILGFLVPTFFFS